MFEMMVEEKFSAAHFLRNYDGLCQNLHGHNWKVQIFARVQKLDSIGLGVDLVKLKKLLRGLLTEIDHTNLNDHSYFKSVNTTSENIAVFVYQSLKETIEQEGAVLAKVSVWESETSCVTYYPEV